MRCMEINQNPHSISRCRALREGVMGRTVRSPEIPGEAVKGDVEVGEGWSAKLYPVYKDSAPADV